MLKKGGLNGIQYNEKSCNKSDLIDYSFRLDKKSDNSEVGVTLYNYLHLFKKYSE